MWNDILWWVMVAVALFLSVRVLFDARNTWLRTQGGTLRDAQLEGLIAAHHLQKNHFYLFVWDIRTISQARANDLRCMLHAKGIESGCMRVRPGTPPIVYDLKRPEEPVKGI